MLRMKRNQFEYLCLSGKLDKNNYRIAGKLIFTDADVEDVRAAFESLDNVYS